MVGRQHRDPGNGEKGPQNFKNRMAVGSCGPSARCSRRAGEPSLGHTPARRGSSQPSEGHLPPPASGPWGHRLWTSVPRAGTGPGAVVSSTRPVLLCHRLAGTELFLREPSRSPLAGPCHMPGDVMALPTSRLSALAGRSRLCAPEESSSASFPPSSLRHGFSSFGRRTPSHGPLVF